MFVLAYKAATFHYHFHSNHVWNVRCYFISSKEVILYCILNGDNKISEGTQANNGNSSHDADDDVDQVNKAIQIEYMMSYTQTMYQTDFVLAFV